MWRSQARNYEYQFESILQNNNLGWPERQQKPFYEFKYTITSNNGIFLTFSWL